MTDQNKESKYDPLRSEDLARVRELFSESEERVDARKYLIMSPEYKAVLESCEEIKEFQKRLVQDYQRKGSLADRLQ